MIRSVEIGLDQKNKDMDQGGTVKGQGTNKRGYHLSAQGRRGQTNSADGPEASLNYATARDTTGAKAMLALQGPKVVTEPDVCSMSKTREMGRKKHAVVLSTLEQGHLIPSLQLSLHLAARGLAVTFVTTPHNASNLHHRIAQARSSGLLIRFAHLPLPSIDGLPPGQESCDALHPSQFIDLYLATEQLQQPLEDLLQRLSDENGRDIVTSGCEYEFWGPPTCIVGDMFTGWVQESAEKLGIPGFTFLTSPAFSTLVYNSLWCHLPHLSTDSDTFVVPDVPSVVLSRSELSGSLKRADRFCPWHLLISRQAKKNLLTRGHIVNSFYELEPRMIEFMGRSTGKPVWAVGPILPPDFIGGTDPSMALTASARGKEAAIDERGCLEWLDRRERASVVYVSFGSRNFLSKAQIRELALGLEASGKAFVWALRVPGAEKRKPDISSVLPAGFEHRTEGRGLVVPGWAPQLLILSHPSTGAFITHCGWNSMLEGLCRGVPLICWPLAGEQFLNARWFVHDLRIAVEVRRGDGDGVPRGEVERIVRDVLGQMEKDDDAAGVERRMQKQSQLARAAVAEGGSSAACWDALVKHICSLRTE